MNYQNTIKVIAEKKFEEYDYILDIDKLENSTIWKKIFEFCSEHLNFIGTHYNVEKPIICFIDDDEINAYAYRINNDYLISFTRLFFVFLVFLT